MTQSIIFLTFTLQCVMYGISLKLIFVSLELLGLSELVQN